MAVAALLTGCQFDRGGTNLGVSTARGTPDARGTADARAPEPPPPSTDAAADSAGSTVTGMMSGGPVDAGAAEVAAPDAGTSGLDAMIAADATADDAPGPAVGGGVPCPADPELALCLRFEGRLVDESPVPLAVQGRALRFVPGASGLAAELGADSQLTIEESPRLDATTMTLEVRVNPRALGDRMTIVGNPGQYTLVVLASGSAMCSAAGGYALETEAVRAGSWTRLRCVFDGQNVRLWVDGRLAAMGPSLPLHTDRPHGLRIGWDDLPARPFTGLVDELRVWREARPPGPGEP
jgi:hypothetical protein